ncbi:MAG: hypothetical protein ACOYXC_01895 [Candidatus Rifleibacteriota bacterium]
MKRGIILPAVLVLISLLVLLALTRNYFSRQQLHLADMISEKEQAYHAADGLRRIGVALINEAIVFFNSGNPDTLPKLEKSSKAIKPILSSLLNSDGSLFQQPFKLVLNSTTIGDFVDKLQQSGIKLGEYRVELQFLPQKPLFHPAASGLGLQSDPAEISWKMVLRSHARVGNGVETLIWYRQGRTISLQPPVVGKFSLFINEPDSSQLNRLDLANVGADGSPKASAVMVNNGAVSSRASLEPVAARDFVDSQGWIYLGESAECELKSGPGTALINTGFFSVPLESGDFLATKGTFRYYYYCDNYSLNLHQSPDGIAPFSELPADEFLKAAVYQVNGSHASPSPTLVVGRVKRSFPIVQGLSGVKSGRKFPFPMLDSAAFPGDDWPCRLKPEEVQMIRKNFDDDYQKYVTRMSFIYSEPANAANLQLLKPTAVHEEYAVLQPESLPASVSRPPALKRLQINGNPAEFIGFAAGAAYSLVDQTGGEIFKNAPFSSFKDLNFLKAKAVRAFKTIDEAEKKLEKNKENELLVPGAILIESSVDLKNAIKIADCGAILLVQGDVFISADQSATNGRILTLVSLAGNISIADGVKVDAALVALQGEINLGAGASINGLVACRNLRPVLAEGRTSRISYRDAFDVTSTSMRMNSYRLCPEEEEYYLVE